MTTVQVEAPWTEAQVKSLNGYQHWGQFHPFTWDRDCDGNETILIATCAGWVAEEGGPVVQTWCHSFMADLSWENQYCICCLSPKSDPEDPDLCKGCERSIDKALKRWAVWVTSDMTIRYLDKENGWTTHHGDVRLFKTKAEADEALVREKGEGVEEVSDEKEFRARRPTWPGTLSLT